MARGGIFGQYLTMTQAAKYLGVSIHTFRFWIKNDKLNLKLYEHPASGRSLILKDDVDRIFESLERKVKYVDV